MHRQIWSTTIVLLLCSSGALAESEAERIDLSPRRAANDLTRVSIEIEAGGHTLIPQEAAADAKQAEAKPTEEKLPMSVTAKLKYDERCVTPLTGEVAPGTPLAVRYYNEAEAVIKVDDSGRKPKLAGDRKLIAVESGVDRPVLFCIDGPLSREQFDLIDVVGDTSSYDRLLPTTEVAKDDNWSNDAMAMGPLLTLDSVAVCEVKSVLESFNASFAKVRFAGTVQGTADGAATEVEVRGVYLYSRSEGRISRLNLAVRERRSIGDATPGFDAVAKLQIQVEQLTKSEHLDDATVERLASAKRATGNDLVYESGPLGFRLKHDRHWYITSEQRESVVMRRVEQGDLIAQCTLTALPPKSAGRQTSLEQFQQDVTYSLGKSFGELVSSRQWQNSAGLYCYELVIRGFVQEVPVEWHYYLIAPESGNRISAAITLEKPMVDRLGQTDRELIESLELLPRTPAVQTATKSSPNKAK